MPKSIAILAPSSVPFQLGGAEKFWLGLRQALAAQPGWICELIKIPVRENTFADIVNAYKFFSELDLTHFDVLVTSKYPAWIARHPRHICYMQHPLRGLYDCYHFLNLPETLAQAPAPLHDLLALLRKACPSRADLPAAFELCQKALAQKSLPDSLFSFPGPLIREVVHFFDRIALAPDQIQAYAAISNTVAQRANYFPQDASIAILHHPSDLTEFSCRTGEYFFTASRINASKRLNLIVDAMAHVPEPIALKIAGTGPELEHLRKRAAHDSRIEFLGHVPDAEMAVWYANAIAVPFAPLNEDYGLITFEAFKSGKPVITTTDAGGVCELVENGKTGLVVEPKPVAIGKALSTLANNRRLAESMGSNGRVLADRITWEGVASQLLHLAAGESNGPKVLVASPFQADAHGAGGPRRLYHFCQELAKKYEVELVCLGGQTQRIMQKRQRGAHFGEISLPWPDKCLEEALRINQETGQSADDLAIARFAAENAPLTQAVAEAGKNAVCVILSHPWLYSAVKLALPNLPVFYDAHNVEADLKKAIFASPDIEAEVLRLEQKIIADSCLIFVCAEKDRQRMQELYRVEPEKLLLLPNGCQPAQNQVERQHLRQRLPYSQSKLILFIGSGHKPNLDAAKAIFELAGKVPDAEFLLAGTVSTQAEIRAAKRPPNAHLLGSISENVKNILLSAADLAINPVLSGSGTNLKIVEYLAYGLPCISTPFGARGLPDDLAPGLTVVELAQFPLQIQQFLESPPQTVTLKEIGQRIARQFAWSTVLSPLGSAISNWTSKCVC